MYFCSKEVHFREGSSINYWPSFSFDYSNMTSHGHGLATGFYPPHYCVYDDPEFYFRPLFNCFDTVTAESEPSKFQLVVKRDLNCEHLAVWFLIGKTLYVHSIDIVLGKQLNSYDIEDVEDFVCSESKHGTSLVCILTTDNLIKIGFLDDTSAVTVSVDLLHSIDERICALDTFLYGDTLVCSIDKSIEKVVITLKNYQKFGLISICIHHFSTKLPSNIVTQIVSLYTVHQTVDLLDHEWKVFINIIKQVVDTLLEHNLWPMLDKFIEAIQEVLEVCQVLTYINSVIFFCIS